MERGDIDTATVLTAVHGYGVEAFDVLTMLYSHETAEAVYEREVRAGWLTYDTTVRRPWLTPEGERHFYEHCVERPPAGAFAVEERRRIQQLREGRPGELTRRT